MTIEERDQLTRTRDQEALAPLETALEVRRTWVRGWTLPDVLALALCLVALVETAWVATRVFDHLPHVEDDTTFLFQAKLIASGHLLGTPSPQWAFFQIPFIIVRDGHWFGKYPPGYPAVLALGVLAGHPWLLNPVVGAIDVGLVYLIGRRLFGAWTGLLAAALLVASPFFMLQAGSFMSHTVSLLWAVLFLFLFEAARRRRSGWLGLLAGAVIGMLFITRPLTAVGIGLPFALWAVIESLINRRRLRQYLPMLAGFIPFVLVMLEYNRMTTGHATEFAYVLWWPYDKIGFGPGHGPNPSGFTLQEGWFDTHYNLNALGHYLYGWPGRWSLIPLLLGALFAALGLLRLAVCRLLPGTRRAVILSRGEGSFVPSDTGRSLAAAQDDNAACSAEASHSVPPQLWDLLLLGIAVSLIGVHVAYWTPGQLYGPRYYFEAIGALVLLSARGLLGVVGLLAPLLRRVAPRMPRPAVWAALPVLVVVATLMLWNFNTFAPARFQEFTDWYHINGDGVRAVQRAGIHHAVVFVPEQNWTDYAPFFDQNTPTLNTDVVYAIDFGNADAQLMVLYPGRAYYRYDRGQLTRLPGP